MTAAAPGLQSRRFSVAHLALLVPWVALVIDAWNPIGDNSFLWHVRAGTLQASQGAVLTTDPFSFTMFGERWLTQSWLVELFYGWAEGLFGLGFVPFMLLFLSSVTFVAIGLTAYKKSQSVTATVFVLILSVLALISFLVPRPVLFSYLLMSLVILAWERRRTRWTLPFLLWVWASVHASFIIGLGYVGLVLIIKRDWRQVPTVVVSGLATLATAHGFGVVTFLMDFGESSDVLRYLTEWRRPGLLDPVLLPLLGGLVFIIIGAFRGRIFPRHLWLVVPFTLLGLSALRAIPPAWLALVPLVALSLSGLEMGARGRVRPRLGVIFAIVILCLPFLLISDGDLLTDRFPVQAAESLDDVPTFHDDVIGGFLIWAGGPERRVFIDDRAELYGERISEFVNVRRGELDWEPVFERDGIQQALLPNDEGLASELLDAGWSTVFEDEKFIVLRERAGS